MLLLLFHPLCVLVSMVGSALCLQRDTDPRPTLPGIGQDEGPRGDLVQNGRVHGQAAAAAADRSTVQLLLTSATVTPTAERVSW